MESDDLMSSLFILYCEFAKKLYVDTDFER
ncbi:MAG: hypothetical protein BWY74_03151 [Firmicutes bacterium ADurb.Bin419]|nr:MAG: hypothetical protein BWY74_03151 [Firmicutes bacterium ADurb.Bin419]